MLGCLGYADPLAWSRHSGNCSQLGALWRPALHEATLLLLIAFGVIIGGTGTEPARDMVYDDRLRQASTWSDATMVAVGLTVLTASTCRRGPADRPRGDQDLVEPDRCCSPSRSGRALVERRRRAPFAREARGRGRAPSRRSHTKRRSSASPTRVYMAEPGPIRRGNFAKLQLEIRRWPHARSGRPPALGEQHRSRATRDAASVATRRWHAGNCPKRVRDPHDRRRDGTVVWPGRLHRDRGTDRTMLAARGDC